MEVTGTLSICGPYSPISIAISESNEILDLVKKYENILTIIR
jgi:hypothetical protein